MTQAVSCGDDARALLDARAAELARPLSQESDGTMSLEMLVVTVCDLQVGIPVERLREVRPPGHVTRLPGLNGVLVGVVGGHRGALAAASLAGLLGLSTGLPPDEQWVAVLDDHSAPLGLLVDATEGVVTVASADLRRQPDCGGLITGRTHSGVLVLDPAATLSDTATFCTPSRQMKGHPWDEA